MQQTEHEKYLVEEVGIDYADGLISRREALRRLGMMGVGAMAASSLLAACADDAAESPRATATASASASTSASATTSDPTAGALPAEDITFSGPNGNIFGAYSAAEDPEGAVLVPSLRRGRNCSAQRRRQGNGGTGRRNPGAVRCRHEGRP